MDRSRNSSPSVYEICAGRLVDIHYGRRSEKTAEGDLLTDAFSRNRDNPYGSCFIVKRSESHLISYYAGNRLGGRITRDRDHIKSDGADAGHRLKLLEPQSARLRGGDHPFVFRDRYECTGKTSDIG